MDTYLPTLQYMDAGITLPSDTDWRNGLLIRSTNWLGDAVMTLPAVYQMRRAMPKGTRLSVLSPRNLAPIWHACSFVDNVIEMADKRISKAEIDQVRHLNAGVAMVLPNSFGSAQDIWKTHIPIRIGRRGRWRAFMLTHRLPEWPRGEGVGKCHQLSYYLSLASALGTSVEWNFECPPLTIDASLATKLGIDNATPWLAMAPGAAYGPAKQWPIENFEAVGTWYTRRGGRVVLLGGGKEKPLADALAAKLPTALNLAGKTDLYQLMAVLSAADKVLANDSGAMHLAAALGRPGVAIFGSTDPIGTGPIGGSWKLYVASVPCRPCFLRECPLPGHDAYRCLHETTPDMVEAVL